MAIERLEGSAIAAAVVGRWGDHTYVTSSGGSVWPCWGRGAGGTALPNAAGYAEHAVADCLSQHNSRAGIAYGLTGVCHQTANRILFPATGASVMHSRAYWASHVVFGTFGLPVAALPVRVQVVLTAQALLGHPVVDWPIRRQQCMPPLAANLADTTSHDPDPEADTVSYLMRVNDIYAQEAEGDRASSGSGAVLAELGADLMRQEADLATEFRLGANTQPQVRDCFRAAYANVFRGRQALLESLASGEIGPGAYFVGVDDIVSDSLCGLAMDIAPDVFERFFGFPPQQRLRVVDPDIGWPYVAHAMSEAASSARPGALGPRNDSPGWAEGDGGITADF